MRIPTDRVRDANHFPLLAGRGLADLHPYVGRGAGFSDLIPMVGSMLLPIVKEIGKDALKEGARSASKALTNYAGGAQQVGARSAAQMVSRPRMKKLRR